MKWGQAHPGEVTKVPRLLSRICICGLNTLYKDMILEPHLQKILRSRTGKLKCSLHPTYLTVNYLYWSHCYPTPFSRKMYNLKDGASVRAPLNRDYTLMLDTATEPVIKAYRKVGRIYSDRRLFILFDSTRCMKQYPVLGAGNLSLAELRELLGRYQHLHAMITDFKIIHITR